MPSGNEVSFSSTVEIIETQANVDNISGQEKTTNLDNLLDTEKNLSQKDRAISYPLFRQNINKFDPLIFKACATLMSDNNDIPKNDQNTSKREVNETNSTSGNNGSVNSGHYVASWRQPRDIVVRKKVQQTIYQIFQQKLAGHDPNKLYNLVEKFERRLYIAANSLEE